MWALVWRLSLCCGERPTSITRDRILKVLDNACDMENQQPLIPQEMNGIMLLANSLDFHRPVERRSSRFLLSKQIFLGTLSLLLPIVDFQHRLSNSLLHITTISKMSMNAKANFTQEQMQAARDLQAARSDYVSPRRCRVGVVGDRSRQGRLMTLKGNRKTNNINRPSFSSSHQNWTRQLLH